LSEAELNRPLAREHSKNFEVPAVATKETAFEKGRGINHIEVRLGYANVHVSGLSSPVVTERMKVLKAVADAGVSLDFLKLPQDGLSFVVNSEETGRVEEALKALGVHFDLHADRAILLAHAVNMRDEEGLIARIVSEAIASGAEIDHLGDMHDRVLIVTDTAGAEMITHRIRTNLMEALA
jgi:aspartate kinase